MIKQVSSVSYGEIKPFKKFEDLIIQFKLDVKENYDKKPLIIFCEKSKDQIFLDLINELNIFKFL